MSPDEAVSDIFECRRCGDCCRGYGGTVVDQADIRAIAAYLDMTPERIRSRYCVLSGTRPVLTQQPNGYCAFWDRLCTIHPVKPRMCRDWPFIRSVLVDVANWRIMAGLCPGIRTDISDGQIIACVKEKIRTAS
ncbi:MAG: Fe-S oxidoreductase [Deltaproteobacteria bacterium SG8_13]|nr:MAG: Fe-S oxidoreductase [Deltaproteobacteria bacterium SG8_13]